MTIYFRNDNFEEIAVDTNQRGIVFDGHFAYFEGENSDTYCVPVTRICEIYGGYHHEKQL